MAMPSLLRQLATVWVRALALPESLAQPARPRPIVQVQNREPCSSRSRSPFVWTQESPKVRSCSACCRRLCFCTFLCKIDQPIEGSVCFARVDTPLGQGQTISPAFSDSCKDQPCTSINADHVTPRPMLALKNSTDYFRIPFRRFSSFYLIKTCRNHVKFRRNAGLCVNALVQKLGHSGWTNV